MYLRVYTATLLLCLLLPALAVVAVDPYRVWHDYGFREELYSTNQRYQNAGLIRKFLECDDCSEAAVIIGTSVSENTTLHDLRESTGLDNAVRLIVKGSYPAEHWHMLNRALASDKVSVLFWEIYKNYATPDFDQFPSDDTFPVHLYTKTVADDYPYLLNHSVFGNSIKILTSGYDWMPDLGGSFDWSTDLATLNSWQNKAVKKKLYQRWNSPENLNMLSDRSAPRIAQWQGTSPDWSQPAPVFQQFIAPLVAAYPNVQFIFFTPPVGLPRHSIELGDLLSNQLAIWKKLAELADTHDNVTLYSFDLYLPLVSDMAYYKDAAHYTAAVNRWMLERMMAHDSRFILSTENVDAYGEELWELAIEHQPYSSCIEMPEACGVWNTP